MNLRPRPSRSSRSLERNASFLSNGWLFADLMLGLAMVFLVANTLAITTPPKQPQARATPTPTVIPTATPLPRLDTNPTSFVMTVDYAGLMNNTPSAVANVQAQFKAQDFTRRAGIVLVYAGTPDQSGQGTAITVGTAVIQALEALGAKHYPALIGTSYHPPLISLGQDYSQVKLEVYLYERQ